MTSPAEFDGYIDELEALYRPSWSVYTVTAQAIANHAVQAVYDYGCGTGRLAACLPASTNGRRVEYFGYDIDASRSTFAANRKDATVAVTTTADAETFDGWLPVSADVALVLTFCLHDQRSIRDVTSLIERKRPSLIIVWDLTPDDLPLLTRVLREAVGFTGNDPRGRGGELLRDLPSLGYVEEHTLQRHEVVFPDVAAVAKYVVAFGLDRGEDLGLAIGSRSGDSRRIADAIRGQTYPLADQRCFLGALGRTIG